MKKKFIMLAIALTFCAAASAGSPTVWRKNVLTNEADDFVTFTYSTTTENNALCLVSYDQKGVVIAYASSSVKIDPVFLQTVTQTDHGFKQEVRQIRYKERVGNALYDVTLEAAATAPDNDIFAKECAGPAKYLPPEVQQAFHGYDGIGK